MAEGATERGVVVVLSWFGKEDTLACVSSLLDGALPATVLVVDNGSFDGTLEAVTERWPAVQTLQTGRNLGFAGGMNAGIRWALARHARFITVLNNDTLVTPAAIARLQAVAASGAAVCPEIYYRDRPDSVWFGGAVVVEPYAFPYHLRPSELAEPVEGVRPTEIVTGCCITASARTWQQVGEFDERFFLNFEDSEWSLRAQRVGVPLLVATDATILHAVSASFARSAASLGTFYYIRNGLLFGRLAGNSFRARFAFVWFQGPHAMARELREGRRRGAALAATELVWAVVAHTARRYGPAPRGLQRLARDLTRTSGTAPGPG